MASLTWPDKDPDEILDYELDWTARLAGDLIVTSTWIMPTVSPGNLTKETDSFTTTSTFIWLSAGLLGSNYSLVNRITTLGGRRMDQTVRLRIKTH